MNWRQRAGIAYLALTDALPKQDTKQKLTTSQLGSGLLDNTAFKLTTDETVSSKLLAAFRGWVYANVSVLAEEVSKMEFELYQIGMSKGEIVYNELETHPLLDLLDRWNPQMTNSEAMYMTEAHLELAGDTFYLLDKPVKPETMFILDPTRVKVIPGGKEDDYKIIRYDYRPDPKNQKDVIEYEADYIIQLKNPNPENPYRGKSVVEAAALEIDTDNLAGEFLKQLFRNGAVANFILSSPNRITPDELKRMQADIKRNFTGAKNAFKTMILTGGLEPKTVQQGNKELQFLEIEHAMRDKIMALFKNTPASLGIVEDVNRANAEASLLSWKESVIRPKMARIVDTLNEFLVPRFGDNLVLSFCDPVPENRSQDIENIQKLMSEQTRQVLTVNEARDMLGLDPLSDPEFDTITVNNTPQLLPFQQEAYVPKFIDLQAHLRRNKIYEKRKEMKALYESARVLAKRYLEEKTHKKEVTQRYHSFSDEVAFTYASKQIKIAEVVEKRFLDKLNKFIEDLEEKTIANLQSLVPKKYKKNRIKAINPFDVDFEIQAAVDLFTPLYEEIATLAGSEAYQLLNLRTLYNPSKKLRSNIERAVKLFTESFITTDRDKLVDILETGVNEGQSVPQMESSIREHFTEYRKNQSLKIARTETIRASNQGALDAFEESGVVEGKQWLTAEDGRVDEECEALDGTIVGLESKFFATDYGSGETPPIHPNCRCVLIPVILNEKSSAKLIRSLQSENRENKEYIQELEELVENES